MGIRGEIELVISPDIALETCEVLERKFGFSQEKSLQAWERLLDACTMQQDRAPDVRAVPDDEDDDRIVACALFGKVDIIISGDAHLLKVKEYKSIRVMRLSEFLESELQR